MFDANKQLNLSINITAMKRKTLTLIFASTLLVSGLFSQTVNKKIESQIKNPKTAENSGKADVYIQKKISRDSILTDKTNQSLVLKNEHKRKKHCKKNTKNL
jgi:hypothetical protein